MSFTWADTKESAKVNNTRSFYDKLWKKEKKFLNGQLLDAEKLGNVVLKSNN